MNWLMENLGTILVGAVLLCIVVLVLVKQVRDRKAGKSTCSCGCEGCASAGICHQSK